MYIALRHNKVVHYSQNAYVRSGSTLICQSEGISIDSATMAEVEAVPTDIDEYDYYYIEGNFIKEDFKVAKLKQEIIDQESTTQEILTNTNIIKTDTNTIKTDTNTIKTDTNTIKTDTNTIKSNVADIKSDTDLIGSTTDTGGSTTAGTVMGKLNSLISSTEIYGIYPVLPSEAGCILIPVTSESGVSTNKSGVLGYGTFTPTLDILAHGVVIKVDVDWTSSSGSSSDIKIIKKGASSADIEDANPLMVYDPTMDNGSEPSSGIHYLLNGCALEAGVTYEIVGRKATLSNLSVSYKLGNVSKGCEIMIYQNSNPTLTSKYLALTDKQNVQNIYISTSENFTAKLRFKGNSKSLKATVNGTDHSLSASNTEKIVIVPLNISTPLTITITSSSTSPVHLYYAYLELIPTRGLAIA